jgi:putative methyltransferase (TIGR04325 family)
MRSNVVTLVREQTAGSNRIDLAAKPVPVVLFAYARPTHLRRSLACMRENQVPLIYAFADGPKSGADASQVDATRAVLRGIDWCEVRLTERVDNFGLGRNVIAGVTEVVARHNRFIVWEDDLICVPGAYAWLCAALEHYENDARVMSVTAWTHPRVTPPAIGDAPYFDARAECWIWGGWARSWQGMANETAEEKFALVDQRGLPRDAYGADLLSMAQIETRKNIWAVRWLVHHLARGGLCVRPPWSMVEHIGFDAAATHASAEHGWANPTLRAAPPIPKSWPEPIEHPACRALWQSAAPAVTRRLGARLRRIAKRTLPACVLAPIQKRFFRVRWAGDYGSWSAAQSECDGYDAASIAEKVTAAARAVRDGRASYERDGVVFLEPPPWWAGTPILHAVVDRRAGKLSVLDVGGSLGSTYFQLKSQVRASELRWHVVEQATFVEIGRREFQNEELKFYASVSEACSEFDPDVILLASVLPYLPSPLTTFAELLQIRPEYLLVERTGFTRSTGSRLTIQYVPRSIYRASYPCWFLDRRELLSLAEPHYRVLADYREDIDTPEGLEFRSLHFVRLP